MLSSRPNGAFVCPPWVEFRFFSGAESSPSLGAHPGLLQSSLPRIKGFVDLKTSLIMGDVPHGEMNVP
jgi:hypothetical protein